MVHQPRTAVRPFAPGPPERPAPAARGASRPSPSLALLALLALPVGCGHDGAPAERPNVLLVVVDTLRRDRVGAYPDAVLSTPTLEALAAEGWRFDGAQAPRAKTTPSVATLFTGAYPHEHGVRDLSVPLDGRLSTLAEGLAGAGYGTAAIVGNYVLSADRSGLDRGFEHWVEDLPDRRGVPPHDAPQRVARSLTDGALAALGLGAPSADGAGPDGALLDRDAPWFLYLHYMDPHGAYAPPAEFLRPPTESDLVDAARLAAEGPQPARVADYNLEPGDRLFGGGFDAARVRARYDGEVRYVDAELGRLFAALRASGELDSTLVIVTSDHGESLGEHRYWFEHGLYAYEATTRVPLLVRAPAAWGAAAGVRSGDLSLADLAPTLIDLLGIVPEADGRATPDGRGGPVGRSRRALWLEDRDDGEPVFSVKTERADLDGTVQLRAVRRGPWKLIRGVAFTTAADGTTRLVTVREELYDLGLDPAETRDLAADPPADAPLERLRADLDRLLAADADLRADALAIAARRARLEREDPGDRERLRQLGYE